MSLLSLDAARTLFGANLLEPEALATLLGGTVNARELRIEAALAEEAHGDDCVLLYRPGRLPDGPAITLASLFERLAALSLSAGRFRGDDPWFLHDPSVASEPLEEGWALVSKEPWLETRNQTYDTASEAIARRPGGRPWRRRRGIEAAFDTLAFHHVHGVRLLAEAFDWTVTPSADGGLVNVGGFGAEGLDVLAYSRPVKHGWLGSCPTLVAG